MKWGTAQATLALLCGVLISGCNQQAPSAPSQNSQTVQSNRLDGVTNQHASNKPETKDIAPVQSPSPAQIEERSNPSESVATALAKTVAAIPNLPKEAQKLLDASSPPSTDSFEKSPGSPPPAELLERANNGDVAAQRDLGKFFNNQENVKESNEWYLKAAEQGDAEAQRILGIRYTFGQGVPLNMEEAGKWFLLAAEQGDAIAQRELARVYGDQWKFTESNDWYLKAALQGDAESQRMLGLRYTIGQGIESDREEGKKWFLMAAEQGDAIAQRELGKYYGEKFFGERRYRERELLEESNAWYLKAALQGDMRAQHMMGVRYTYGQGVERNIEEASKWFLLAAEQGDSLSQFSIGVRWARGEAGEPQDFTEAAKWFRLSAEQGLDVAQLRLGQRYAEGTGVEQDNVEAYKWLWLAQNQGHVKEAGKMLEDVTAKMTPEQIAEAREKAKAFVPTPGTPLKLE